MRDKPTPFLNAYLKDSPVMQRAWEIGRDTHLSRGEPQAALDLAEHYVEHTPLPKNELITFFLAMPALQTMTAEQAAAAFGPAVAAVNEELRDIDMGRLRAAEQTAFLSALATEAASTMVSYIDKSMAQAQADFAAAQRKTKQAAEILEFRAGGLPPGAKLN